MAQCPHCQHDIIEVVGPGGTRVVLDAHAKTYVACDFAHIFPEAGDQVALGLALVEHAPVCAAVREAETRERVRGKATYQQRKHGSHA